MKKWKSEKMKKHLLVVLLIFIAFFSKAQYTNEINAWRENYKKELLEDERTPVKAEDIKYLQFFAPDESYRVIAEFTKTENAVAFDIPTMSGKTKKYIEYGKLKYTLKNKPLTLTVYQGIALLENPDLRDYLFVPFTDSTNGNESYINGRYLDFRIGDIKDNKLIVDFNKAYNPYCAFSDGFNCPKPPEANDLKIAVMAGERDFGKKRH